MDFDIYENCDNEFNNEFKNEINNEFNNEISFVKKCLTYFFMINFFYHMSKMLYYYSNTSNTSNTSNSSNTSNTSDSSDYSDSSSDNDSPSDSCALVEVKYEDKYLDDIKKMSMDYRFSWAEIALRDNKFNELFGLYKTNLINEKNDLENQIMEKSMKYIEIDDDDYENISYETLSSNELLTLANLDLSSNEALSLAKLDLTLERKKEQKVIEEEIILLRSRVKELDSTVKELDSTVKELDSGVDVISKLRLEARQFVIKEMLDGLKNNFVFEKTPLGNVIMYWNNSRESFEFYSDNTIPYRYLETVGRKYVKTFNCRQIYVDMEFELREFERKLKEKQDLEELKLLEEKKKMELELEQNTSFNSNSNLGKKDVFAKFKNYNKESGTGKVNRGAAPPKNSIPNNNSVKKDDEKTILKENANRYTCEGKIANFSFLKKPDRKVIDKKYAMSFADYKKLNL